MNEVTLRNLTVDELIRRVEFSDDPVVVELCNRLSGAEDSVADVEAELDEKQAEADKEIKELESTVGQQKKRIAELEEKLKRVEEAVAA